MVGEMVGKAHHAVSACAAFAAGDRDLSGIAPTGQCAWAGGDTVFAKRDGMVLKGRSLSNLSSGNHKKLKNRTTKQSPERAC